MKVRIKDEILKDYRADLWGIQGIVPGAEFETEGPITTNYRGTRVGYPIWLNESCHYVPPQYCEVIGS